MKKSTLEMFGSLKILVRKLEHSFTFQTKLPPYSARLYIWDTRHGSMSTKEGVNSDQQIRRSVLIFRKIRQSANIFFENPNPQYY